jgi:hypothetical protein
MRWLIAVLLGAALSAGVQAASIEARLIRASNDDATPDEQLTKLEPKLKKVFGYQHYLQLGIQKALLKDKEPLRLNLGEGIVILISPKADEKKVRVMDFEMYSGKAALVKSTVRVPHSREMLIKGPGVGSTLLVVSLVVVE